MPGGEGGVLAALKSPAVAALSCLLLVQAAALHLAPRTDQPVVARALKDYPKQAGSWTAVQEIPMEPSIQAVLKADDSLNRTYASPSGQPVSFFVAFFRSQRSGVAPHSPKNCLPGSGWAPLSSGTMQIPIPGRAEPIEVNRYIVSRGEDRTLVLYWYQTAHRVIASEYLAKFWLVADSIRYHRSDTSLVRIVAPMNPANPERAEAAATSFVQSVFPQISGYLPH